MNTGARVALGVGIGYLLGRSHKMRLALMVAAAGAAGRMGGSPGALLQRGLSASPELAKMTDTIRGELVGAVKAAALNATSNRIDSLSERIRHPRQKQDEESEPPEDEEERSRPDTAVDEESDEDTDEARLPAPRARRRTTSGPADEEPDEDTGEAERAAPRARSTAGRTNSRTTPRRTKESDSDAGDEAPRRRRAARETSGTGRAPVRRTRR